MKIAVLGAGNVGGGLGKLWAGRGHEVRFAVPDPGSEKIKTLLAGTGGRPRLAPTGKPQPPAKWWCCRCRGRRPSKPFAIAEISGPRW